MVLFAISSVLVILFSGIRQSIAIGIGMVAFGFVRRKQFWRFLICVILAMGFHSSAVLLLLLYPVYHVKITKNWLYWIVPVMITVYLINQEIFSFLLFILSRYSRFAGTISSTGAYTILILFAMLGVFSFLIPEEKKLSPDTVGLRNILLLVIVLQMFAPLHSLAMRMNYYFIPFVPILIPRIIRCRRKEMTQVAEALEKINQDGQKAVLEIYTGTTITEQLRQKVEKGSSSRIMGSRPYEEIKRIMHDADVVLHVESFEEKQKDTVRYSFSTKIIDCLQSGAQVLGIGPEGIASVEYLKKVDGAVVVDQQSLIGKAVAELSQTSKLLENAGRTRQYALQNHEQQAVQEKLRRELEELLRK